VAALAALAVDAKFTRTVVSRRFGPLVKWVRLGIDMAQEDVEAAGGVGRHTVGDTESRKTHATIENGKRISHAMDLKLWMLCIVIEHDEAAGPDNLPARPITRAELQSLVRRRLREELGALGPEPAGQQVPRKKGRGGGKNTGGIPP